MTEEISYEFEDTIKEALGVEEVPEIIEKEMELWDEIREKQELVYEELREKAREAFVDEFEEKLSRYGNVTVEIDKENEVIEIKGELEGSDNDDGVDSE